MVCFSFPTISHILGFRLHYIPINLQDHGNFNPVTRAQRKLPVKQMNWWKRSRGLASREWMELQTAHAWPGKWRF